MERLHTSGAFTVVILILTAFCIIYTSSRQSWSKQKAALPANQKKGSRSQTYRLQGIPTIHDSRSITISDVEKLVRQAYFVEDDITIFLHSLASHPTRPEELVATLTFSMLPKHLAGSHPPTKEFGCLPPLRLRLDTHFHGLTPLHSHRETNCNLEIVALSGLNGHAFGSFKARDEDYMWLRDDLSRELHNARVYIYGYGTEMIGSDSFQSLDDLGSSFRSALCALLKPKDKNCSPNPLVLIGHSLGGLVIKQGLCQMAESKSFEESSILKCLQAVLFFGTPNHGMNMESLVPMIADQANEPFVRALDKDSAVLLQQAKQWYRTFNDREGDKIASSLEIISFYETKESPTAIKDVEDRWKMIGPCQKLVEKSSATHGRTFDVEDHYVQPINRNHSDLVKFHSPTDEVYTLKVLSLLRKFYNSAQSRRPIAHLSRAQQKALHRCRDSLSFDEEESHVGHIVVAENHTCTWFPKHPLFQTWLQRPRELLWLQGLPGAGKSTIMKHAFEEVNRNPPKGAVVASFFIHGLGVNLQKTLLGLYCSVIKQLLPQVPFAFLPMIAEAENRTNPETWGQMDVQRHFKRGLKEASKTGSVILFIDALDELDNSNGERDTVLATLRDLCYGEENVDLRINICVSSRYHPNLYNRGSIIPAEQNNQADISTVVRHNLEDLPGQKRTPLEQHITNRAQGVFQWAQLVCKKARDLHLKGTPLKLIMSSLKDIPSDLHSLYDRLLGELDEAEMERSLRLFRWVGFTTYKLNLRQLQHALALSPNMTERSLPEYAQSDHFLEDHEDLKNTIKNLSKGLIGFEEADSWDLDRKWGERVNLIHLSVMDYLCNKGLTMLEKKPRDDREDSPEGAAHHHISRSLLRYMFMRGTREEAEPEVQSSDTRFPLDDYASSSIMKHIESTEQYEMNQIDLLRIFGWPNEETAMNSFRSFGNHHDTGSRLLHLLASCNVRSALKPLIDYHANGFVPTESEKEISLLLSSTVLDAEVVLPSGHVNLDLRNSILFTPLHVAITWEQAGAAHDLLGSARVDKNALAGRMTPLHIAANKRNLSTVVKALLDDATVDPNAQNKAGETPLHCAVEGFADEAINMLMQAPRINPNIGDTHGRTPLHAAIRRGLVEMVDVLFQFNQVDYNVKNKKGQTPLFEFFIGTPGLSDETEHAEHTELLEKLLQHPRIRLDVKDHMQRTPLYYAANEGSIIYVRILLRDGRVSAGDKDKLERTPLSQAAAKGHEEIVRMFLVAQSFDEEVLRFAHQQAKNTTIARLLLDAIESRL